MIDQTIICSGESLPVILMKSQVHQVPPRGRLNSFSVVLELPTFYIRFTQLPRLRDIVPSTFLDRPISIFIHCNPRSPYCLPLSAATLILLLFIVAIVEVVPVGNNAPCIIPPSCVKVAAFPWSARMNFAPNLARASRASFLPSFFPFFYPAA